MAKSRILKIIASFILLVGVLMIFEHFTNEEGKSSLLGGIGCTISGVGIFLISRTKEINKGES